MTTDLKCQISKAGRFFVVSFTAEEFSGVGLKEGARCYVFNDTVLCTKKTSGSALNRAKKLAIVCEMPVSSCQEAIAVERRTYIAHRIFAAVGLALTSSQVVPATTSSRSRTME